MDLLTRGQRGSRYRRRNASNRKTETNSTEVKESRPSEKPHPGRRSRKRKPQNTSTTRHNANSSAPTSPPWSKPSGSTSTAPTTPMTTSPTKRQPPSPPAKANENNPKNNTTHLIPRGAPPKPTLPGFLRLPPEIRWQIYSYLFPPRRVEITRQKDTTNPLRQNRYRLYHRARPPRRATTQRPLARPIAGAARPLALPLTCRTTYTETILHLYATTQFVFAAPRAAARFLARTTPAALAAICHVELAHVMYNEPRLSEFRRFKHRSDLAFFDVCAAIAQRCVGLRVLHVDLAVMDWPIRLQVGERWSWPLVVFSQYGDGMDYVDIRLRTGRFDDARRREVARQLEQMLMKPECFQRRDEERKAQKKKARKVLTLVF